jgi:hypothetical protein
MKKIIYFILIVSIFLPVFSFAQISAGSIKEKGPGILEEWGNVIKTFWEKQKDVFFSAFKKAWDTAVRVWEKMWVWFKSVWNNYIWPKIEWLWQKIIGEFWQKTISFFRKKK